MFGFTSSSKTKSLSRVFRGKPTAVTRRMEERRVAVVAPRKEQLRDESLTGHRPPHILDRGECGARACSGTYPSESKLI